MVPNRAKYLIFKILPIIEVGHGPLKLSSSSYQKEKSSQSLHDIVGQTQKFAED